MSNIIGPFRGEYAFLSNFYPAPVELEGVLYPTVEHAFQAVKTMDIEARRRIAALSTPSKAKMAGRSVRLRSDWDQVKIEIMIELVRQKFTRHPDLAKKLLTTGEAKLVEFNDWKDTFWGVYRGRGENMLGKILMDVRKEIRDLDIMGDGILV